MSSELKYDLFVSYAHADNEPPGDLEMGWISSFKNELRKLLHGKMGGQEAQIWMDHELGANDPLTSTLTEKLRRSKALLIFLSPSYQASEWCRKELESFLQSRAPEHNKANVFVVEIAPVEHNELPHHLRELVPIRFWENERRSGKPRQLGYPKPTPDEDNPYWRRLNELSHQIAAHLRTAWPESRKVDASAGQNDLAPAGATQASRPRRTVVWIAEPTDDLIDHWESLAGALRQAGCEVRPATYDGYPPSTSPDQYAAPVKQDLATADLLVQLLSRIPGRRINTTSTTYTAAQNRLAVEHATRKHIEFLPWRAPAIALDQISDADYKQLLTGTIACGFEEFRQRVVDAAQAITRSRNQPVHDAARNARVDSPSVCVNVHFDDRQLGQDVAQELLELGADVFTTPDPHPNLPPSDFHAELERVIHGSDGVIIVYGNASAAWVQAHCIKTKKIRSARNRIALLDGPPVEKPAHGITSASIVVLNCRNGVRRQELERFMETL